MASYMGGWQCLTLTNPSYGNVSVGSYFPGGTATYSCNSGYKLSGSSIRNCSSSRIWSGSAPSCLVQCPSLFAPSNGQVSVDSSPVVGTLASFSCNYGYSLSGFHTRTCSSDGTWSGSQPSCQPRAGTLSVFARNGQNLPDQDGWLNESDPYMEIIAYDRFGASFRLITSYIHGTLNPAWNQWLHFGARVWTHFTVRVYDSDDNADDLLCGAHYVYLSYGASVVNTHRGCGSGSIWFDYYFS